LDGELFGKLFGKFCTAASRLTISGPLKERTDLWGLSAAYEIFRSKLQRREVTGMEQR